MGIARTRKKAATNGSPERLDKIYRVAAEIICEKGFDATSMSDIADAMGLTKAGIYHYVSGKKELLFAIMNYAMDMLDANVVEPARQVADPEQRLKSIILNHAKLITGGSTPHGHNPLSVLTDEIAGLTKQHRRKIIDRKRAYLDLVRTTLQELKNEKRLKDVDVTVGAFSLFGMLLLLSRWYRPDGDLSSEQVADEISNIALFGILK